MRLWLGLIVLTFLLVVGGYAYQYWQPAPPIKVGVLHSQTGTMAFSEKAVLEATLAAIAEVNANGGVLGRMLLPVVADGASDEHGFAKQAERLLVEEKVAVIFGGWTSASRKAMLPVLEKHQGLLFYPVQYEGMEVSEHVIYTGLAPNQQLYPGLTWMTKNFGRKVVLVGSDYIYPRMANAVARQVLASLGVEVCDEVYVRLGGVGVQPMVDAIAKCRPDYVLNTINGSSNVAFFAELKASGLSVPVLSMSMTEVELAQLTMAVGRFALEKHFAVWGYFHSLESAENKAFLSKIKPYLSTPKVNHPMKAAWDGVHLWANAVKLSGVTDGQSTAYNLAGMSQPSATGPVTVSISNHHLWQKVYIGQAGERGEFVVLWQSDSMVKPSPWPMGLKQEEWLEIQSYWFRHWGNQWQAH